MGSMHLTVNPLTVDQSERDPVDWRRKLWREEEDMENLGIVVG